MADPVDRISDKRLSVALARIRGMNGSLEFSDTLQEMIPGFRTRKGIYKPQNSDYALWIRQTSKGAYPDGDIQTLPDGSWLYRYTPEAKEGATDLNLSTNRALLKSMDDRVPVGVFIQARLPGARRTYEVMGLAYVEEFDGAHFVMHGQPIDFENEPMHSSNISPFAAFEYEPPRMTESNRIIRDRSFQTAVRRVYKGKCSLCELGYTFRGEVIGVEAAHIIPVKDRGTSKDVRNGILLCRNHHDLFDRYLWAFDEDYRVVVSEDRGFRKSALTNHILKAEGKQLSNLPNLDYDLPGREAIDFRLERFLKTQ